MTAVQQTFDGLVQDGLTLAFRGWDFAAIGDRWTTAGPPWDYRAIVTGYLPAATALLDMGTGGGEFLSSLTPLPPLTCATESYPPNVKLAQERLAPLGIEVRVPGGEHSTDGIDEHAIEPSPYDDATFDLVINRHDDYTPSDVWRLLKPGGVFITQQVGGQDNLGINERLGAVETELPVEWTLASAREQLTAAGFTVLRAEEAFPPETFTDIGAIVFYLRIIEWQIPGFTVEGYRAQLEALHAEIEATGCFVSRGHRFLLVTQKPLD